MRISAKTIGSNSLTDRKTSYRMLRTKAPSIGPKTFALHPTCYIEDRESSQHGEFAMGEIKNVHDAKNYGKPQGQQHVSQPDL